MKIRKIHVRKRYRYNVNRKALNRKHKGAAKIKDPTMKKFWQEGKVPNRNFNEMGLSSNPNKSVPIPSFKQGRLKVVKIVNGFVEEKLDKTELPEKKKSHRRGYVAEQLEARAKERRDPEFRLPKGVVSQLSYFLDKYQLNYKAMTTDRRNHEQWTWKQFRMKIRKFMSIPEQFNAYLEKKNIPADEPIPWEEYDSDSEWV